MNEADQKRICKIFKSPTKEEMYLYVDSSEGLSRVPEVLLQRFGTPKEVMTLLIRRDKALARASAEKVLDAIAESGFYLQMPPQKEDYLLDLYKE